MLQQRGDGRRTLGQALQAVGKTGVENETAFLAERVHFDDDRVRQRVTDRQHPDHVVGLISMPDTGLIQVDYATRNFRTLMCMRHFSSLPLPLGAANRSNGPRTGSTFQPRTGSP